MYLHRSLIDAPRMTDVNRSYHVRLKSWLSIAALYNMFNNSEYLILREIADQNLLLLGHNRKQLERDAIADRQRDLTTILIIVTVVGGVVLFAPGAAVSSTQTAASVGTATEGTTLAGVTLTETAPAAYGTIGLEAGSSAGVIGGAGSLGGTVAGVQATAATVILENILNAGAEVIKDVVTSQIIKEVRNIVDPKKQPAAPASQQPTTAPSISITTPIENINDFLNNNKDKIGLALTAIAGVLAFI